MNTVMMTANFVAYNVTNYTPKSFMGGVGEVIEKATVIVLPTPEHMRVTINLTINWDSLIGNLNLWHRDIEKLGELVGYPGLCLCPDCKGTISFVSLKTGLIQSDTFGRTIKLLLEPADNQITIAPNLYTITV